VKNTQVFHLGDFESRISLYERAEELFSFDDAPSIFVSDETVWDRLSDLLPRARASLEKLPLLRSLEDLSRLEESEKPGFRAVVILPGGEAAKTFSSIELILQTAFQAGLARDSRFVALGGGAVTDVAAFASSLFMRGNRLILIPSTLLAMVDAAFGGKTGINYFNRKNMVGTFYPASEVRVFPNLLESLPEREYLGGLAEVIKSAMLDDAELFALLERQREPVLAREPSLLADIIWRSLMVKGRVVLADLRESGVRAHLNLGHTFAHALEALSGIEGGGQSRSWNHGEAVAWGILRALKLGETMGRTDPAYVLRCEQLLRSYGYRLDASGFEPDDLISAMKSDKKKQGGTVPFVLQKRLGETFRSEVDDDLLRAVLN
jgi:3-dehydroquinate synthase